MMKGAANCSVHIERHRGCKPYNRQVFGQFMEHFHRQIYGGIFEPGSPLSDRQGFRTDVIEAIRELHVPIVRWPGGCFVSAYHWRDGIGPHRHPTYDKAWLVEDPNTFGTDEFIQWCRKIGAEPYICTNAGSGDSEEMSDWVEYCNGTLGRWARLREENGFPKPHAVRYWSIGNENYGDWEMGAKTIDQWAPFVTESAKMMLHVDPMIRLSAAALASLDWTLPLLRQAGRYLSYVSVHKYWDPLWLRDESSSYSECMMATHDPENVIRLTRSIIHAAGLEGTVKIAFDEWNLRAWHHPAANGVHAGDVAARDRNDINATYTMADAVFSACFLNACIRNQDVVEMACMAPLVNTRGPIVTYPTGIVKRTTYHTLWMYANLLEKNFVSSFSKSGTMNYEGSSKVKGESAVSILDALATCDDRMQRWRILLINKHPTDALRCRLHMESSALNGAFDATVLSSDSPDAFNDIGVPDRVAPVKSVMMASDGVVSLPPHSISILEIAKGD